MKNLKLNKIWAKGLLGVILFSFLPLLAFAQEQKTVKVAVYYRTDETTVSTAEGLNYPEISVVSFVATMPPDPDTGRTLYDNRWGVVALNVTAGGLEDIKCGLFGGDPNRRNPYFGGIQGNEADALDWKGFFYSLGHMNAQYFGRGFSLEAEYNNSTEVFLNEPWGGGRAGLGTVTAVSWYWGKAQNPMLQLNVDLSPSTNLRDSDGNPVKVEIDKKNVQLSLNVDNCDFVREKIYKIGNGDYAAGIDNEQPNIFKGETYAKDPGKFVLDLKELKFTLWDQEEGFGHPYTSIWDILVSAQESDVAENQGKIRTMAWPVKGGGADWVQVSAAELYNSVEDYKTISNCVWKIMVGDKPTVSGETPYLVQLCLFSQEQPIKYRFNGIASTSGYGFQPFEKRDGMILHEAVHCYHFLPGAGVYDNKDLDHLYVADNESGAENPKLKYSFDHKYRGFMNPSSDSSLPWLNGDYGPKILNDSKHGIFVSIIDLDPSIFGTLDEKNKFSLPPKSALVRRTANVPTDFPGVRYEDKLDDFFFIKKDIRGVYLYREGAEPISVDNFYESWIKVKFEAGEKVEARHGRYLPLTYYLEIKGFVSSLEAKENMEFLQAIKQKGYDKLVIISDFRYLYPPYEFDADYNAIIGRN